MTEIWNKNTEEALTVPINAYNGIYEYYGNNFVLMRFCHLIFPKHSQEILFFPRLSDGLFEFLLCAVYLYERLNNHNVIDKSLFQQWYKTAIRLILLL